MTDRHHVISTRTTDETCSHCGENVHAVEGCLPNLELERRGQEDKTVQMGTPAGGQVIMTPPIDEDYWTYRVQLTDKQAVVGFPKFGTIGIGFQVEADDWNTNFPYQTNAQETLRHILRNKGDDSIRDEDVLAAIKLIQAAAREDAEG